MLKQLSIAAVAAAACALAGPAFSQVVTITQQKAIAGGITPGDGAGYPITLSQSGSYRVDSNLTGSASQIGIQVTATNVSIDLNGFTLNGAGVATIGIFGNSVAHNVTVENGTIERFKQDGVLTSLSTGYYLTVNHVSVVTNGRYGVASSSPTVTNSRISDNGSKGVLGTAGGLVQNSEVSENGDAGVQLFDGMLYSSLIRMNKHFGFDGNETSGVGNSVFIQNNPNGSDFGPQIVFAVTMQPNACIPACQ